MSAEDDHYLCDNIVANVDTQINWCEKFVTENLAKVQEMNEISISSV